MADDEIKAVALRFNGHANGAGGYRECGEQSYGKYGRTIGPFQQGGVTILPEDDAEYLIGLYNRGDSDPLPVFTVLSDDEAAAALQVETEAKAAVESDDGEPEQEAAAVEEPAQPPTPPQDAQPPTPPPQDDPPAKRVLGRTQPANKDVTTTNTAEEATTDAAN